jgi:hypothetical protein
MPISNCEGEVGERFREVNAALSGRLQARSVGTRRSITAVGTCS